MPRRRNKRRALLSIAGLSIAGLSIAGLIAGCQAPANGPGARHALFVAETAGETGGIDVPAPATIWSLEAQAARTCPAGYDKVDEQERLFSQGKEWVWWVRCAP